jgi:hypothetical protein
MRSPRIPTHIFLFPLGLLACGDGLKVEAKPVPKPSEEPVPGKMPEATERSFSIESPRPNEVIARRQVSVRGSATGLDEVRVGGHRVVVRDGRFAWELVVDRDGPMTVEVAAAGIAARSIPVVVDTLAPSVAITSPARGAFVDAVRSRSLKVEGTASDSAGIARVVVNGREASLDPSGRFAIDLEPELGAELIVVEAEDRARHVLDRTRALLFGRFAPFSSTSSTGSSVRLRTDALQAIGRSLSGRFTDLIGALPASDGVSLQHPTVEQLTVELTPGEGQLFASIHIEGFEASFSTTIQLLGSEVAVTGSVQVGVIDLDTELGLEVREGALLGDAGAVSVRIQGVELVIDTALGARGALASQILSSLLEQALSHSIEECLSGCDLGPLFDPASAERIVSLFGRQARARLALGSVRVDTDGIVLGAGIGLDLGTDRGGPGGPLVTEDPEPSSTRDHPLSIAISDDLLNHVFFALWRSGVLELDVSSAIASTSSITLDAGTLAILLGPELLQHVAADRPVSIRARAALPPIARIHAPSNLTLAIADLAIEIAVDDMVVVELSVSIEVSIALSLSGGRISSAISASAQAEVEAEPLFDVDDGAIESLVAGVASRLPDRLAELDLSPLLDLGAILPGAGGAIRAIVASEGWLSLHHD